MGSTRFLLLSVAILTSDLPSRAREVEQVPGLGERFARERVEAAALAAHRPHLVDDEALVGDARIDAAGASVGSVSLGLAAIGRPDALGPVPIGARPSIAATDVRVERAPGIVEWWRSLPSGLEHGVSVAERPAGPGPLVLAFSTGRSVPALEGDAVALTDAAGRRVGRYAHLSVLDAAGATVPARLAVHRGRILVEVDDARARYPLMVDPLLSVTEEAFLVASMAASNDRFGQAVALSSGGVRAVVGANTDDTTAADAGSVRVFLRTGTTWIEEATLVPPDAGAGDELGWSVGITGAGDRVITGARHDNVVGTDDGSARVFVRSGTTWAHEYTITASGGATTDFFGIAVAIAADGTRAVVGAYRDDTTGGTDAGSARVYRRSAGGVWNEEATLLAPGGAASDEFGASVAMTADGSRVLVGAPADDTPSASTAGARTCSSARSRAGRSRRPSRRRAVRRAPISGTPSRSARTDRERWSAHRATRRASPTPGPHASFCGPGARGRRRPCSPPAMPRPATTSATPRR